MQTEQRLPVATVPDAPRAASFCAARGPSLISVSRAEWSWLGLVTLALYLVSLLPPTLARVAGPADRVHLGTYWYAADFSVYLSAMREGMTSPGWLVHNHTTAEPHNPALIFPLYVAIGKLAGATGLPVLALYAVVEAAARLVVLISVYLFVARFLATPGARRFGYVLAILTGGLGIWVSLAQAMLGVPGDQLRGFNPGVEITPFGTIWAAPHLALGLAATLLGVTLMSAAAEGHRAALVALGMDIVVLGLVHPFNLPVLVAAFGLYALVRVLAAPGPGLPRRIWAARWSIAAAVVAGVFGSPLLLYNALTFAKDPFWSATYGAQNSMLSPLPHDLLLDCGVTFLLAPFGIFALARHAGSRNEPRDQALGDLSLLLVLLATILVCIYIPVPYQRRFAVGLVPTLAVFSVIGWPLVQRGALALAERWGTPPARRPHVVRRLTVFPLILFGFTSTLFVSLGIMVSAMNNAPIPLYFVDRATFQLGELLAARTGPDDVVLTAYASGNVYAGLLPGRVVVGNIGVTPRGQEKLDTIQQIYRGELSPEETRAFLQANRVTYLIVGEQERKAGTNDPGAQLGFPVVLRSGDAVAYRVTP